MKTSCNECSNYGLEFKSKHITPSEYIEGNPNAEVWIVGLNPKSDIGHVETRTKEELENFDPDCHRYFADFKKVSPKLYRNWKRKNSNVAHTDLVKCFSHTFPPFNSQVITNKKKANRDIIDNCSVHLIKQIHKARPKLIICNGAAVCREMIRLFPPEEGNDIKSLTSYRTQVKIEKDKHKLWIVLSGFVGRIDDRSKRRLGREIEEIIELEEIRIV